MYVEIKLNVLRFINNFINIVGVRQGINDRPSFSSEAKDIDVVAEQNYIDCLLFVDNIVLIILKETLMIARELFSGVTIGV